MRTDGNGERSQTSRVPDVVAWAVFGCLSVVAWEFVLTMLALITFSHIDTPECASTNTFCSPDGRPGLTGGAVVVLVGNALAVLVVVALLVRHRIAAARR